MALIVIAIAFPQAAANEVTFFDVSSGRFMREWKSFGRTYQTTAEETEYSRLLKKHGAEESSPEWKKAYKTELGIRRLFFAQNISYDYGRVAADAIQFAMFLETANPGENEAHDRISQFRALLRKGTPTEVYEFVQGLQHEHSK